MSYLIAYAANPDKTDQSFYVSGVNCIPEVANEQFLSTKHQWQKTGGVTAYHVIQSFAAGEVDAETAHEIGVKLAEEMFGERFEVVVATHLNTDHVHTHVVVNSVSFVDGKKYDDSRTNYYRLRDISDSLCREYGLSVIENPQVGQTMAYNEWRDKQNGKPTIRDNIRETIDVAIRGSANIQQFLRAMDQMGYIIDQSGKYPKIKQVGAQRFVRFKSLGAGYDVEDIKRRIRENNNIVGPYIPPQEDPKKVFEDETKPVEHINFVELYCYFVRALTIVLDRPETNRRMNFLLRDEQNYARLYSNRVELVTEHNITNMDELLAYRMEAEAAVAENIAMRQQMYNALRHAKKAGDETAIIQIRHNIQDYNTHLNKLRREIRTCDGLAENVPFVREKLMRIQQGKFRGKDILTYDVGFARVVSDQLYLVYNNDLKSMDDVKAYKTKVLEQINQITELRLAMYSKLPDVVRSGDAKASGELRDYIEAYTQQLKYLREDVRACDGIIRQENRKGQVSQNMNYAR